MRKTKESEDATRSHRGLLTKKYFEEVMVEMIKRLEY